VCAWLQISYSAETNNDRTVDTEKFLWIQRFLKSVHGHVQQMSHPSCVQFHIVFRTLYPIQVFDIHEQDFATRPYGKALQMISR